MKKTIQSEILWARGCLQMKYGIEMSIALYCSYNGYGIFTKLKHKFLSFFWMYRYASVHYFIFTVNVGEDCPVFDGLYDFCQLSSGGSIGKYLCNYISCFWKLTRQIAKPWTCACSFSQNVLFVIAGKGSTNRVATHPRDMWKMSCTCKSPGK